MLRFALSYHQTPLNSPRASHWDLFLEQTTTTTLLTWALDARPKVGTHVSALPLSAHRQRYLSYSGLLSESQGIVTLQETGHYIPQVWEEERKSFLLFGQELNCYAELFFVTEKRGWIMAFSESPKDRLHSTGERSTE
ncbi:MAG: hypothetical protein MPJ24_00730 [Pirellulaceae bacterium]|nr:hypothetical protein [Pirellulaceae bacterium]